jgi:NAD-dependent SIR2 family protein deacetylase
MPVLTFPCPKCKKPMGFDYADYDLRKAMDNKKPFYYYEKLECESCGKKLVTVPWIVAFDEEEEEVVAIV